MRRKIIRKLPLENVVNGKVQDYRFAGEKPKNIPDAGLASFHKERGERRKCECDSC